MNTGRFQDFLFTRATSAPALPRRSTSAAIFTGHEVAKAYSERIGSNAGICTIPDNATISTKARTRKIPAGIPTAHFIQFFPPSLSVAIG